MGEIAGTIVRRVKRERPDITLGWRDDDGDLIDFSDAGYTFQLSVARSSGGAHELVKTSGIVYVSGDTKRNVRITFAEGELDDLVANVPYNAQLDAILDGAVDRGFQDFIILFTPEHS